MKEIEEKLFQVFQRVFDLPSQRLTVEMTKDDIDSWDSIGHLQLVMNIEADFGIKFKTEEISGIKSFEDCVRLIENHKK